VTCDFNKFLKNCSTDVKYSISRLGGVMVIVLAIEPKVQEFKPGRGGGLLGAINIRSTTSFRGEIKPTGAHVVRCYGM
jgi:hypothetical protein